MYRILPAFLAASLATMGCITPKTATDESDDTGAADGEGGGNGGGGGDTVSIYDIQIGDVEPGEEVTLKDVVVTSPRTAEGAGFFVQDQGGGEYAGIYVYIWDEVEVDPQVGDMMTLQGTVDEFYDFTELVVKNNADAEITGQFDPVTSVLASEPANWEAYESVLVTVGPVTVTDASDLSSYGEVQLDIGIKLDDGFVSFEANVGDAIDSATGLIFYSFEEYKLSPRTAEDIVGLTTSTPTDTDVEDIQTGAVGEGARVTLTDVVVTTPLDREGGGFYVQDAGGGQYSGIYIFVYEEVADEIGELSAGQTVTLSGSVTEFYDFTELTVTNGSDLEITGNGEVTLDVVTSTPSDWEPWEGCLVTISDITVSSDDNGFGDAELSNDLLLDDAFYWAEVTTGDHYGTISGVISYGYSEFRINPRDESDLNAEGTVDPDPDPDPDPVPDPSDVSIVDIQGDDVAEDTVVTITDVVVTSAIDTGDRGFYVQDAGGGEYAGIYIYTGTIAAEEVPTIAIGSVVTITGTYIEFYDLSEISVSDAADITVTDTATPVVTSISETPADWESYEGVLVSLDYTVEFIDEAADEEGDCLTYGACELDNGLLLDDELFGYSGTTGDTYAALTGLISYAYSAWRIYPRDASDLD